MSALCFCTRIPQMCVRKPAVWLLTLLDQPAINLGNYWAKLCHARQKP